MVSDYGSSPADWAYECCGEIACKCADQKVDTRIKDLESEISGLKIQLTYKESLLEQYRAVKEST